MLPGTKGRAAADQDGKFMVFESQRLLSDLNSMLFVCLVFDSLRLVAFLLLPVLLPQLPYSLAKNRYEESLSLESVSPPALRMLSNIKVVWIVVAMSWEANS